MLSSGVKALVGNRGHSMTLAGCFHSLSNIIFLGCSTVAPTCHIRSFTTRRINQSFKLLPYNSFYGNELLPSWKKGVNIVLQHSGDQLSSCLFSPIGFLSTPAKSKSLYSCRFTPSVIIQSFLLPSFYSQGSNSIFFWSFLVYGQFYFCYRAGTR